jgi:hypothetical protein
MSAATSCSSITPGDTVQVIIDRLTGETRQAQIFVAVMGASNFGIRRCRAHQPMASRECLRSCSMIVTGVNKFVAGIH